MSRPNARQLSMRDPAAAVLLGAIAGADFGNDRMSNPFGAEFGNVFGTEFGSGSGVDDDNPWGHDPGYNFGFDHYGAEAAARPSAQQMAAVWNKARAAHVKTQSRQQLLEPNKDSNVKIERYSFQQSQALTIGTAIASFSMQGSPDVNIRPQRLLCNAPIPGFVFISLIKVANVVATVGPGVQDAYDYNAESVGTSLDLPTLTPSNKATITAQYTGIIPPIYTSGLSTFFTATFLGWADIVA